MELFYPSRLVTLLPNLISIIPTSLVTDEEKKFKLD